MAVSTAAAWVAWGLVLFSIDPTKVGGVGIFFFFLCLFIALLGSLSLFGIGIRLAMKKDELISRQVFHSFRQAIFLTVLIIGSLILLANQLFTILTALLLILVVTFIELACISAFPDRKIIENDQEDPIEISDLVEY